jgi:hypothetical protein
MHLALRKLPNGLLAPADAEDVEALQKVKLGQVIHADFKQMRNVKFHRKFFAMLNLGFDAWEPPAIEHNGLPCVKNRERFRKDCLIAAGFCDVVVNLMGTAKAEAKSISFASMDDTEFERVYSAVADVLLRRVLTTYTRADLDRVVDEMLAFT